MSTEEAEQKEVKIDKYRIVLPKKWRDELGISEDTLLQELYHIGKNFIEFRKESELKKPLELPAKHVSVFGTVDNIGRIKISSEIRDFIKHNLNNYISELNKPCKLVIAENKVDLEKL